MNSKVTLKEMVATKIIYAVLLVIYYWMWARRDWHDYYSTVQNMAVVFTVVFFSLRAGRIVRFSKEEKDELAVQNLRRTDAIALKIMVVLTAAIAFACAVSAFDTVLAGYALMGMILALAIIRSVIFWIMDSKGI